VLLLLDRGLTAGQIGLVLAAQGIVVMLLELPTGGLADSVGRRVVLLAAAAFDMASLSLLVVATTMPLLVAVFALQGIYRALESGPLDAWYVDAAQAVEPNADIEAAMGASGAVLGAALAVGTVAGSALVALDPIAAVNPLIVPLLVALVLRGVELVTVSQLMVEPLRRQGRRPVRRVPAVVRDSLRMVRGSHALAALIAVELLWGAGMIARSAGPPVRRHRTARRRNRREGGGTTTRLRRDARCHRRPGGAVPQPWPELPIAMPSSDRFLARSSRPDPSVTHAQDCPATPSCVSRESDGSASERARMSRPNDAVTRLADHA
jgi:MFS family permease